MWRLLQEKSQLAHSIEERRKQASRRLTSSDALEEHGVAQYN